MTISKNKKIYLLLCFLVIFIDQLSKYFINKNYNEFIGKDLIIFSIDYVKNYGAAFNILSGNRILLSLISIIISLLLLYLLLFNKNSDKYSLLTYSFILGGTIGNGIDRIINVYGNFYNLNY